MEWGGNARFCEMTSSHVVGHRRWYLPFFLCFTHLFLCWSTSLRRSEHASSADEFSSHGCRSCRTGEGWCKPISPWIVVLFYLNSGPICHISAQESQICEKIYFFAVTWQPQCWKKSVKQLNKYVWPNGVWTFFLEYADTILIPCSKHKIFV